MKNLFRNLSAHFFGYHCVCCGKSLLAKTPVCFTCLQEVVLINQSSTCSKCGRYCITDVCYFCIQNPHLFLQAKAFCVYGLESAKIIKSFKYYNNTMCEDFIFQKLLQLFNTHFVDKKIDIIVPVPMSFLKEWWKGYNHSGRITKKLAQILGIQCYPYLIKRKFSFIRQAGSTKSERVANIQNMFTVNKRYNIQNKNILLVDDVVTTAATANECTKVLLEAGVCGVFLLTFAKSIADEHIIRVS